MTDGQSRVPGRARGAVGVVVRNARRRHGAAFARGRARFAHQRGLDDVVEVLHGFPQHDDVVLRLDQLRVEVVLELVAVLQEQVFHGVPLGQLDDGRELLHLQPEVGGEVGEVAALVLEAALDLLARLRRRREQRLDLARIERLEGVAALAAGRADRRARPTAARGEPDGGAGAKNGSGEGEGRHAGVRCGVSRARSGAKRADEPSRL